MIDMHSHILWSIDDGPKSLEESISMAMMARDEGISTIIATPHCIEIKDLIDFRERVEKRCCYLQNALDKKGILVKIIPGTEVYMDPDILEKEGFDRLTLGDTNYILIEMPMGEVPRYAEDFLYHIQLKGLRPIIAHPERNRRTVENPNILARLIELGSLTQINSGSISGFFGSKIQENAKILLTHNMIHLLGTDAHSNRRRGPHIKDALKTLYSWLDEGRVDEIINHNPKTILKNGILSPNTPITYTKKRRLFDFLKRK